MAITYKKKKPKLKQLSIYLPETQLALVNGIAGLRTAKSGKSVTISNVISELIERHQHQLEGEMKRLLTGLGGE